VKAAAGNGWLDGERAMMESCWRQARRRRRHPHYAAIDAAKRLSRLTSAPRVDRRSHVPRAALLCLLLLAALRVTGDPRHQCQHGVYECRRRRRHRRQPIAQHDGRGSLILHGGGLSA